MSRACFQCGRTNGHVHDCPEREGEDDAPVSDWRNPFEGVASADVWGVPAPVVEPAFDVADLF